MKISKILLGIGIAIALSNCGASKEVASTNDTKTTNSTTTTPPESDSDASFSGEKLSTGTERSVTKNHEIITVTDNIVPKKAEMSKEEIQKWPHMDIYTDSIPGMSLEKAYDFLKDKKGETVIVGVIDSGIDIEHEDLKNVIWTNEDEIPNNNIDDDNNGYIDDVYGWNFLGGEKGSSAPEQLEITRIVKRLEAQYGDESRLQEIITQEGKGENEERVKEKFKVGNDYYLKLKNEVEEERKLAAKQKSIYEDMMKAIKKADNEIKTSLNKEVYTLEEIANYESKEGGSINEYKHYIMRFLESGITVKEGIKDIQGDIDYYELKADCMYNVDFSGRVTGDNPNSLRDKNYGNNYVIGSKDDEIHGTHVSGIICAERNNGVGMNGVAHNVALMSIRAVPDGDEYDKDVALAIRYAVDNGAKVINMSFGKSYSPHAYWVYEAIKHADKNDVLLVHAAGNDHKNIDIEDNFPNDSKDKKTEYTDNVLTVGAMTRHFDKDISAYFSNYGRKNVDIFAPGTEIYSTFPKDNYKSIQGTSMASPEVAGVAALVRSYYPSLTASQVKHIIMDSGIEFHKEVKIPTEKGATVEMISFDKMSVSGRILNAYNALLMADNLVNK